MDTVSVPAAWQFFAFTFQTLSNTVTCFVTRPLYSEALTMFILLLYPDGCSYPYFVDLLSARVACGSTTQTSAMPSGPSFVVTGNRRKWSRSWRASILPPPPPNYHRHRCIQVHASSHLCLSLPCGLPLSVSQQTFLYTFLTPSMLALSSAQYISRFDHSNNIWWGVQVMKICIKHCSSYWYILFIKCR
jgi:hypothetical protein